MPYILRLSFVFHTLLVDSALDSRLKVSEHFVDTPLLLPRYCTVVKEHAVVCASTARGLH